MKKILFKIVLILVIVLGIRKDIIFAGTFDNAYTFYSQYGNRAVFKATSQTDGYIYCCTMGKSAVSDTRYKTIGWKMTFTGSGGNMLEVLYFKLGGDYLKLVDSKETGGYKYDLYRMGLVDLMGRLGSRTKSALEKGETSMVLDACMVVTKGGVASGSMNDKGRMTGKVYTDFKGISSAENWNSSAMTALLSYYNKNVDNFFYTISVRKDPGVETATGSGNYCYGTRVTLTATMLPGYEFVGWQKDKLYDSPEMTFYVSGNETWTARAKRKSVIPSVEANDLYYSLDQARRGLITEKEVAGHMRAVDEVDGEIKYGINARNYFYVSDFELIDFGILDHDVSIPFTVTAGNSIGGRAEMLITIHIIDNGLTELSNEYRVRFISKKYLNNAKAGGLSQTSCWKKDISFFNLLTYALEP